MLDANVITSTIAELEEGQTTYDNCLKLAALYIIRDNMDVDKEVETELGDILPQYRRHQEIKRKYYFNEVSPEAVNQSMSYLCTEIEEFLHTLYSSTNSETERNILKIMLKTVYESL